MYFIQIGTTLGAAVGTSFALYSAYRMYKLQGQEQVQLAFADDVAQHLGHIRGPGGESKGEVGELGTFFLFTPVWII